MKRMSAKDFYAHREQEYQVARAMALINYINSIPPEKLPKDEGERLWCYNCNKSEDYCCCRMEGNEPDFGE